VLLITASCNQRRISGPLLDRIDIQMEVGPVDPLALADTASGETSASIAVRVQAAADRQWQRQGKRNQALTPRELEQFCRLEPRSKTILHQSMDQFQWTGRAYHHILRVARTIADLAASEKIRTPHLQEAIQYRRALRERDLPC
jgi:magnesium chelatase family protein